MVWGFIVLDLFSFALKALLRNSLENKCFCKFTLKQVRSVDKWMFSFAFTMQLYSAKQDCLDMSEDNCHIL